MNREERFDNRPKVRGNALPENPDPEARGRFPRWLHRDMPKGSNLHQTGEALGRLPTVCEEARCPNLFECWSKKTATFLAMGSQCTRACGFCDIDTSANPPELEADEPERVAAAVKDLGLRHVVITMVARDDQEDGGAAHLAQIVRRVKEEGVTVELLTSDFQGKKESLDLLLQEEITVFNHNLETVERLTPRVRHKATYRRSLQVLEWARGKTKRLKSGIMVGLGETEEEVHQTLRDLHSVGCTIVTMGQYLQPNRRKLLVKRFITPEQFEAYAEYGREIGIPNMYCGPFVRSSYNADLYV